MTAGADTRPDEPSDSSTAESALPGADAWGVGEQPQEAPDGEAEEAPSTPTRRAMPVLVEWLVVIVCALGLALLLKAFLVEVFVIPSGSMEPTLMVKDRVVVYKLGYRFHEVNRGDVVVFRSPGEASDTDDLIKRVVAVGGETFEVRDGRVYIDGTPLREPYLKDAESTFPRAPIRGCVNEADPQRCEVPEGKILVLGDSRQASRDSRYFGPVDVDDVVGRAFMKIWPLTHMGGL